MSQFFSRGPIEVHLESASPVDQAQGRHIKLTLKNKADLLNPTCEVALDSHEARIVAGMLIAVADKEAKHVER